MAYGSPSRRKVLAGLAGTGAASLLPFRASGAGAPHAIDFHHHFNPPFLVNAAAGNRVGTGGAGLNWDLSWTLEDMEKTGITKAILSPPTGFAERVEPAKKNDTIRTVNEYGANLVRDHKGKFLQLVYMPLPDVDASLKEIARGFDELGVVGAGFATSYGQRYVSDPAFAPVFEELNRRKALCYFHPLAASCCTRIFQEFPEEANLIEIPYDTARAVMGLLLSGAFVKYRDIRWLFSHSGGAIPMFAGRLRRLTQTNDLSKVAPNGLDAEFHRLHYETANASSPPTMAALLKYVPISQVLFGSDHPYVSIGDNMIDLKSCGLSQTEMNAILYENAERLVPQLKA
jgi:predicted TIM-barrel fold metal-dependent hydrolase